MCGSAAVQAGTGWYTVSTFVQAETVGLDSTGSVLGGELQAIWFALLDIVQQRTADGRRRSLVAYTLFTDSKEPL